MYLSIYADENTNVGNNEMTHITIRRVEIWHNIEVGLLSHYVLFLIYFFLNNNL